MIKLTNKDFWNRYWTSQKNLPKNIQNPLHDLLIEFLPRNSTFIEVGCTPGLNMVYFYNNFCFKVSGIDFSQLDMTKKTLESYGIKNFKLYDIDFTKDPINRKYGVVASFGFIEHFADLEFILSRHASLVEENGYLVIAVPNFRWGQYILHLVFDREILKSHNFEAMKPKNLKNIVSRLGAGEIFFCGYYMTFNFWIDNPRVPFLLKKMVYMVVGGLRLLLKMLCMNNIPNPFFSPYVVLIARF